MSRTPAQLGAAAVALRGLATALVADFAGLADHAGPSTWEGPAADAHRSRAAVAAGDAEAIAGELARLADRLDQVAAERAAAADAAEAVRSDG